MLKTERSLSITGVTRLISGLCGDVLFCVRDRDRSILYVYSPGGEELNKIQVKCNITDMEISYLDRDSCRVFLVGEPVGRGNQETLYYIHLERHNFVMDKVSVHCAGGWWRYVTLINKKHILLGNHGQRFNKFDISSRVKSEEICLQDRLIGHEPVPDHSRDGYVLIEKQRGNLMWIDGKYKKKAESVDTNITRFIYDGQSMYIAISSNYDNSLLLIDSSGVTRAHLVPRAKELCKPRALCLDKDNNMLYVSHGEKQEEVMILHYHPYMIDALQEHCNVMVLRAKLPET